MKRSHLLLFLIAFATFVFAYDYQTVSSNRICLYKNDGYIGLRIDSVKSHGQDSVFYPNVNFFTFNDTFRIDGSWIGKRIIVKPNGDNVFINRANDSILIKTLAALKESWLVYQKNGMLKITAEVTSLEKTTVIGLDDSVKTITFHVFDASMKPIANGYEGKQIKISQHYGIIESKSFYYFPDLINSSFNLLYKLGGMTNPKVGVQNLLAKDIWDFNEGDEYHKLNVYMDFTHYDIDSTFFIERIISREQKDDSITYLIDQKYKYVSIRRKTANPTYYCETGSRSFNLSTYSDKSINFLPGEIMINDYSVLQVNMPTLNIKTKYSPLLLRLDSVSFTYGCCEDPQSYPSLYYRGFGGQFRWTNTFSDIPNDVVYYKKNNIEWGKKLVITGISSVIQEISIRVSSVLGRKELTSKIASLELPARLDVLSLSGIIVLSKSIDSESSAISLQSLPAGAYLYRVKGESGSITSGKIILR